MNTEQWKKIADQILATWGRGDRQFVERRMELIAKRFALEPYKTVRQAVEMLERTERYWPAMSRFHEALVACSPQRRGSEPEHERPMTSHERRQIANSLRARAEARYLAGGAVDDPWIEYYGRLADYYDLNADRADRGEEIRWPPPSIPGVFGATASRSARRGPGR